MRSEACNICGVRGCLEHCQWCGVAGGHTLECPVFLGVYPIQPEDVGLECVECNAPFVDGDFFIYVDVSHPAVTIPVMAAVCLGCGARAQLLS